MALIRGIWWTTSYQYIATDKDLVFEGLQAKKLDSITACSSKILTGASVSPWVLDPVQLFQSMSENQIILAQKSAEKRDL